MVVILGCGYSVFSILECKSEFLNEMAETDSAEVDAVGTRIWAPYHCLLISNVLLDTQRTGKCVKHRLAILFQKMCILQIRINSTCL